MKQHDRVIEYNLEASEFNWELAPGKTIKAWGFNEQVPGPTLKANAGDTLVIRVVNHLNEPTMIHWHGLRIPASMDGTGATQEPIEPGKSFEYRFVVPDAGTFWYHSHFNETVQLERGMYGALIVEENSDPVITDGEKVFMIDDMKLTPDNSFKQPGWFLPRMEERHDGRQGNTLLINGKENPFVDIYAGQTERWRFINSSSARYFVLSLDGKEFKIIGTDGGLLEHPRTVSEVLLAPGERIDIAAGPFTEGDTFPIESRPYNRGTILKAKLQKFATVRVGNEKSSVAEIPESLRKIEPLAGQDAEITRRIKLSEKASMKHGADFFINDDVHVNDQPVMVGDLQIWEVTNASMMDHPFHLHGFFFQVIEKNGRPSEYIAWKDTVNLTPKSKIKIAWMPDNRPGTWMYHCHILEHHAAGMMATFDVIDPTKPLDEMTSNQAHHHHHH